MARNSCESCGEPFEASRHRRTCSEVCSKALRALTKARTAQQRKGLLLSPPRYDIGDPGFYAPRRWCFCCDEPIPDTVPDEVTEWRDERGALHLLS